MSSDLKSRAKLKQGIASKNEVQVINGALKLTNTPGTPGQGYGESRIKGGIASKGEVEVINGALKVVVV